MPGRREPGEIDLYKPMCDVLRTDWAKDRRYEPLAAIEITAQQGRRDTGGTWSRPDIVAVAVRTFQYVPHKVLEVVSFEVKTLDGLNVQAVYEALAHRRSATRSFVLVHVPPDASPIETRVLEDVAAAARSVGVGLVAAGSPGDYETWEEREDARRVEPEPESLNEFIKTQLNERSRDSIAQKLR